MAGVHKDKPVAVTADRHPCLNPVCDSTVVGARFCYRCEATIAKDRDELGRELDHLLRLEAEFIMWCQEHGQPHPHE